MHIGRVANDVSHWPGKNAIIDFISIKIDLCPAMVIFDYHDAAKNAVAYIPKNQGLHYLCYKKKKFRINLKLITTLSLLFISHFQKTR